MAGRFLVAAVFCPVTLAFSDTIPVVAWSSHSSSILDVLPTSFPPSVHSASLLEAILFNDNVCEPDAVVIVEQPGLHASDLFTLPSSSKLARSLSSSPSARQYPYVPHRPEINVSSIAMSISSRCGSRLITFVPGQDSITFERGFKYLVSLTMPHLHHSGRARKDAMVESESMLSDELSYIASKFPNHLVVYHGSQPSTLSRRQVSDIFAPERLVLDLTSLVYSNTTLAKGGILKRYQLLTPALITGFLVAFFILLPIAMIGFNALASIQSPLRVEAPKGYSAQERKIQ